MPALEGPLLPPGEPAVWIGGLSDAVLAIAARVADAWNGWGLDADAFEAKVATLRELAAGRVVAPTWAGIALVGEDRTDLERLLEERRARGASLDGLWTGTAEDWGRFIERAARRGRDLVRGAAGGARRPARRDRVGDDPMSGRPMKTAQLKRAKRDVRRQVLARARCDAPRPTVRESGRRSPTASCRCPRCGPPAP